MAAKTNYLEAQILNHVLRGTVYTSPPTIYVALFTAAPGEAGGGTEVIGGSYARQSVAFTAPVPDTVYNTTDVTFPIASADWGTVVAFALMDSLTSGNMLYYTSLTAARTVLTNDQFRFPTGQLSVSED